MKIFLEKSACTFKFQIEYLQRYLNIKLSDKKDCDISLSCSQVKSGVSVTKNGKNAEVRYGKQNEFFKGLLELLKHENNENFEFNGESFFETNGVMIDNSRNAVMTVDSTKLLIAYSALIGFDHVELYIEDTFEVNNQPYFGYMRMRYTKEELKEINEFAKLFGILIIPCIETLAHLNQIMRYNCYSNIRDIDDILLVGDEGTYKLIEDIISSYRECLDSPIIHIGMDEAHNLGKGKYLDKNGLKPRFEIMCDHLKRVIKICKKYNFKPMMWSDMFFELVSGGYYTNTEINENLSKLIPKDVELIYWDYYTINAQDYDKQMKKHLLLPNKIGFAGGAWKWTGFLPQIEHSLEVSNYALDKAKENKIKTVFATAWGDDGAECPIFSVLPVLALFGEKGYKETVTDDDISKTLFVLSGYSLNDFKTLASPNGTDKVKREHYQNNPTRYLLYQDLILGMFDRHIGVCDKKHFETCSKKLQKLRKKSSPFSYLFETAFALCRVLELKCDMGVRIKNAYDAKDLETLNQISSKEIPLLIKRLSVFSKAFKKQWYTVNKRGGFDVQDIRLGGLEARIKSSKEILDDYIAGKITNIEELEQEKLPFNGRYDLDGECISIVSWGNTVSANKL